MKNCATEDKHFLEPILSVESLRIRVGDRDVVDGVSLEIRSGEIIGIIGSNGAGKSTFLKGVFGVIPIKDGTIRFRNKAITKPSPRFWLRNGVAMAPQGDCVFAELTVKDNLVIAAVGLSTDQSARELVDRALASYPALKPLFRQIAGTLSGGQKQTLSLAMAKISDPKVLILDEPSIGLSPELLEREYANIYASSKNRGTSHVIVEHRIPQILSVADRVFVLRSGKMAWQGEAAELRSNDEIIDILF